MKMKFFFLLALVIPLYIACMAQVTYPYPVKEIRLTVEGKAVSMAYMDVKPAIETGKNILLLHGKNFNGYYWKNMVPFLLKEGYRVVMPDQLGWGRSTRTDLHYSFHLLAQHTRQLLDSLGIRHTIVLGHSMGGMLATRFSLMFPGVTQKLVLENPIGLEDYKTFVPYQSLDKLFEKEKKASFESYRKYQHSYHPDWKPDYEQYVQSQAADLLSPSFDSIAWVNAVTYQMIYEQPVLYEFSRLRIPVLLVIGQEDKTVLGKDQLTEEQKKRYGRYNVLGRRTARLIPNALLVELKGIGHIPHIQDPATFLQALKGFLN